ncbi:MAG: FAD-dependent oxidoreductase [Gemmatimonadaceae bacterium]
MACDATGLDWGLHTVADDAPLERSRDEPAGCDVAVIGAGPAGCSAARLLARWGHSVTLITRHAPAPSLAESIPPSASRLLEHLNWRPVIDAAGFQRSTGNTVLWDYRRTATGAELRHAYYKDGALGYQVDRGHLNSVMLNATVNSGVVLIDGATVIGVQAGVAHYRRPSGDGDCWARWVLDCSGRTGVVARLGWRRAVPQLRTLAIAGVWERADGWGLPDPSHTVVESHSDGWAWSVPVSRIRRHVTVMLDPHLTTVSSHALLDDAYRAQLARAPGLYALTRGATLIEAPFARDASPYGAHQVAAPSVLLVGDSASFVDPLSSFGIKKALASAWLAAVVVRTCLADASMLRPALELYESRERAMYDALERRRVELAQAALGADATSDFWMARAETDVNDAAEPNDGFDIELLRADPAIRAAFDELKRRESLTLTAGAGLEYVHQPAILEDRVVLEKCLRIAPSKRGVRYIRTIDLVRLTALAPSAHQVPDLFEMYCQRIAPVPLPDFLGALALLIGRRVLEFA